MIAAVDQSVAFDYVIWHQFLHCCTSVVAFVVDSCWRYLTVETFPRLNLSLVYLIVRLDGAAQNDEKGEIIPFRCLRKKIQQIEFTFLLYS